MSRWLARSFVLLLALVVVPASAADVTRWAQTFAQTGSAPASAGIPALRLASPDPTLASPAQVAATWDAASWRAYGDGLGAGAHASGANAVALQLGTFSNDPAFEAMAVGPIVAGIVNERALAVAVPTTDLTSLEAAVRGGAGAIACSLPGDSATETRCGNTRLLAKGLSRRVVFNGFFAGASWNGETTIERVRWAARKSGLLGMPRPAPAPAAPGDLSRRLVQSGAVLLKNDGLVLPFSPETVRSLLVVGADEATLAALRAALPRTTISNAVAEPAVAAKAAAQVAACLLILGATSDSEADLVKALVRANPRTAVVLEREPVDTAWIELAPAVLVAGTPEGLANVLSGLAAPAGRLPGASAGFPLGAGTTYTAFAYSRFRVDYGHGSEAPVTVSFLVGNAGVRAGTAVPRLMVAPPSGGAPRLVAFKRVTLLPGQSRRVVVPLQARAFAVWSGAYDAWYVAPGVYAATVLDAASAPALSAAIRIVSR